VPHVEAELTVPLTFEETWNFCTDVEAFPHYMSAVDAIQVIEEEGNWSLQRWETRVKGAPFKWTEKNVHMKDERRITYRQTEGDLKQFEGEWTFEDAEGGTRVKLTCDFEFGIPMVASLLNPIAKLLIRDNLISMLEGVSKKARSG